MYILTPDGFKLIDIPKDVEERGMFREQLLLYLQSDWNTGGVVYNRGTLLSYDLPSFLSGDPKITKIYEPGDRESLGGVMATP